MSDSTPICRCRVLYLGSSVPQVTKDGLQGIQEPLQELYPEQGAVGARGIDSWLSVWSNGILLENVDENHKKITRFFPIESLHYCAAIRYVLVPEKNTLHTPTPRFLPLDSPFARTPNPSHPPLFAAILRRTTGIKVLECHAFICKREVAANALVRCCFHAYADSSYARQVDGERGDRTLERGVGGGSMGGGMDRGFTLERGGGSRMGDAGSLYGTLNMDRGGTKDKVLQVEDWKMNRSQSGSTMTINTVGNQKDDISIYNGDENHKVWAGSQDNLDTIYDVYSTSTLTRPARPRQIAAPVSVPPPPTPKEKSKKKTKKLNSSTPKEDHYPIMNGKANSINGTMLKPRNNHHPHSIPHQPVYIMAHPPQPQTLPNPKFLKHHGNTFSHRPSKKMLIPARPIPPPFVPMAPMIIPTTMNKKNKKSKHIHAMEEPIYMPSSRALSPVASYQPVNFPHEAYLMQHYATMESSGKHGGKKKDKMMVQEKMHPQEKMMQHQQGKMNKKLAQSMNGLDDPNMAEESPFNTGIYRKKGHLNERAFSYSIRQEHRSRSYGSLANLKFATPIPNGVADVEDSREDIKKEREIMQMVQDLELSGDEIERSEVPRGMYEARGGPPALGGPPVMVNGSRGHRR